MDKVRNISVGRGANKFSFNFICEWGNTRSGFKHTCNLIVNGLHNVKNVCYYYNRTWEAYNYQTVMCGALDLYKSEIEESVKQDLLYKEGKKRLTTALKKMLEKECKANKTIKAIAKCRAILDENFNW